MDLVSLAAVYPVQVWLRASAGVHKVQYDFQKLMAMNWSIFSFQERVMQGF